MLKTEAERIAQSNEAEKLGAQPRTITVARQGDSKLDILQLLPGTWKNTEALNGHGWNMIALPFIPKVAVPNFNGRYRLLLNQYNETLIFNIADENVKNRGLATFGHLKENNTGDQVVVALDYDQMINQIVADDFPQTDPDIHGRPGLPIHREPGLFVLATNNANTWNNLGRQASIPHGNSLLALGAGVEIDGPRSKIAPVRGLPSGASADMLADNYLMPYDHFEANPFQGVFNPKQPHLLLEAALPQNVIRTTELQVSTAIGTGGILNIPFAVDQANPTRMDSTFWIMELDEPSQFRKGNRLIMQYLQVVNLEFFPRRDGVPGLAIWPHVSINTMEWVAPPTTEKLTQASVRAA